MKHWPFCEITTSLWLHAGSSSLSDYTTSEKSCFSVTPGKDCFFVSRSNGGLYSSLEQLTQITVGPSKLLCMGNEEELCRASLSSLPTAHVLWKLSVVRRPEWRQAQVPRIWVSGCRDEECTKSVWFMNPGKSSMLGCSPRHITEQALS